MVILEYCPLLPPNLIIELRERIAAVAHALFQKKISRVLRLLDTYSFLIN
jgi:hypothetical protein